MISLITYAVYAFVSVAMTIWVARTLHKNGRIFLVDAFHGNEAMADSVNHLLVVGFYLINLGFVSIFLSYGTKPSNAVEAVEYFATKFGIVLLALGAMHFFNMFNFAKMRDKAKRKEEWDEANLRELQKFQPKPAAPAPTLPPPLPHGGSANPVK